MGAGVVEVSVEFFHSLLFFGEVVVEFLLLDEGEAEPYFLNAFEVLVVSLDFCSEVIKYFLEWVLGVVARESVYPFVGGGEGVEDESAEESVFGVGDEGFDLFRGAGEDY